MSDLDTINLIFLKSLQQKLINLLSHVRERRTPIFVFNEVHFPGYEGKSGRRVDVLLYVQDELLVSIEYKTSESQRNFRSSYIKQINDTCSNILRTILTCSTNHEYLSFDNQKPIPFISLLTVRRLIKRRRSDYTEIISETTVPNLKYKLLFERRIANGQRKRATKRGGATGKR